MKELSDEYAQILAEKKKEYAEYKEAKASMQDFLVARQNIEAILNSEGKTKEERKEREQQKWFIVGVANSVIPDFFLWLKRAKWYNMFSS